MTGQAMEARTARADGLTVFQVRPGNYLVESSKGMISYKVGINNGTKVCTCGDYANHVRTDPEFVCKHIIAAMNCNGDAQGLTMMKHGKPKLDERFITTIKRKGVEKEFVIYAGLLDLAHQKGLRSLRVEPVQYPRKENGMVAICTATAVTFSGDTFVEVGDADPDNVTEYVAEHIIRVAATRAKARALRDMTNIGMTCLEELGNLNDAEVVGKFSTAKTTRRKKPAEEKTGDAATEEAKAETEEKSDADMEEAKSEPAETKKTDGGNGNGNGNGEFLSKAQRNAVASLAKRRNISDMKLEEMSVKAFGVVVDKLTPQDASAFIRELQSPNGA
jgi:2-keto-3-deoxy-6-phosphogluconate aldolase